MRMPGKQVYTTGWHRERQHGYSRAIRCGDLVFVSGSTGYDYERNVMPDDPADQARAALANIDTALRHLGSRLADVVQLTTYFVNGDDYPAIGAVLGEELAEIRPTNSAILCGLAGPEMKVEISAMAVVGAGDA
jgi:enamine deaminase RidA (YjgF/YER057c/UK114 family)